MLNRGIDVGETVRLVSLRPGSEQCLIGKCKHRKNRKRASLKASSTESSRSAQSR